MSKKKKFKRKTKIKKLTSAIKKYLKNYILLFIQIKIYFWHKHNYNNWQRPNICINRSIVYYSAVWDISLYFKFTWKEKKNWQLSWCTVSVWCTFIDKKDIYFYFQHCWRFIIKTEILKYLTSLKKYSSMKTCVYFLLFKNCS